MISLKERNHALNKVASLVRTNEVQFSYGIEDELRQERKKNPTDCVSLIKLN